MAANRIISAEDLGDVEPFSLNALSGGPDSPLTQRAVIRPVKPNDDTALRKSFELGYRKGMAAGQAAAQQQQLQEQRALGATLRQRVELLATSLETELSSFQDSGAERLMDLAIEIARQTVRGEIKSHPEQMLPVIQEALGQLFDESATATLHVNPNDVELVQTNLAPLLARRKIELRADSAISLGGCQLIGASADVDARVQTRWRRTLAAMGRTDSFDLPGAGDADRAAATNRSDDEAPGDQPADLSAGFDLRSDPFTAAGGDLTS